MKRWLKFFLVATVVFALVAGIPGLFLPPDPYSTLPVTIIGFVLAFSVAYWVVYRRGATDVDVA
ncbi:hypothetical protein [Halomarina litorea]|uniref:hypothetical protein n=1 Tax=Halomarina litorea TaxID=2961595 RepID=UPI0020C4C221|nr:hypothetical protein [Halomarina sp. BCD28]